MKIQTVVIRRFRSVRDAQLESCGGLNVLIGKNNAGKSNILAAIDLIFRHLANGAVAGFWGGAKPVSQFTDRKNSVPIQFGIEFDLDASTAESLRKLLAKDAPQVAKSTESIVAGGVASFVLAACYDGSESWIFLQAMGVGRVVTAGDQLSVGGINLLSVPIEVGRELYSFAKKSRDQRVAQEWLEKLLTRDVTYMDGTDESSRFRYFITPIISEAPGVVFPRIKELVEVAKTSTQFKNAVAQVLGETKVAIESIEASKTSGAMAAFAGEVHSPPSYVAWMMRHFGGQKLLHFRERKDPIGKQEAQALLELKLRRGGAEKLANVQQTVRALLGVGVDAFQEEGEGRAEIDIDDFLVGANGAGVREALRLILDIELQSPKVVLVEEPEVHLHPGLERTMQNYLREKSREIQMFVTTHSTQFVDVASLQNVYLVRRDAKRSTNAEAVGAGESSVIPSELGLKLSTVFMYDRLVFVEGASDEAVLREFANICRVDLTRANVGFVQMGGILNFASFAADATLDLLSRRQVQMWFVCDRDERDDAEVKRMTERLGGRASLVVLRRRDLETYLVDSPAIQRFCLEKGLPKGRVVTVEDVDSARGKALNGLKERVLELRLERKVLRSIHLQRRGLEGSISDRLAAAKGDIEARVASLSAETDRLRQELETDWVSRPQELVVGAEFLDEVVKAFGVRFRKEAGDSVKLAKQMTRETIPEEIFKLLQAIVREP